MADDLFQDIGEYIRISKDALDLLKSAYGALPKGQKRDEIERQVKLAEDALKRSDGGACQATWIPSLRLHLAAADHAVASAGAGSRLSKCGLRATFYPAGGVQPSAAVERRWRPLMSRHGAEGAVRNNGADVRR
jgi:hypothetical protein